jgi:hypothetical protein
LKYYQSLSQQSHPGWVIYAGDQNQYYQKDNMTILGWRDMDKVNETKL